MGLFGSKMDCALCSKPFSKREGKTFRDEGKGGVCHACFEKWIAEGSQCAVCNQAVHGTQDVGFFPEARNFGHYDCGSAKRLQ